MLRITPHIEDDLVLKVEGCLAGACVPELESCWLNAADAMAGRQVRVDLTDVCHVDKAGRELLTRMSLAGVRFTARGCALKELVREITETTENLVRGGALHAKASWRK